MTTTAVSRNPEPYEVPNGGLASFLTATVGDWSDEALNADNYYDIVKPTADQLAEFGREEDDRIAHVATGETIIPMAVFEEDPELKEALFARMLDMGIDPERYIVGSELNSINPVTGQPEFFLKKIFKGVKKAVKGVVKVFKKVAPIILSTVGFMVAGPIGASLGSGIGTLIQGGNLKDAFKSALIAGVTAGVGQGIGAGFEQAGQLGQGASFADKLAAGAQGFGESLTSIPQQFTKGIADLTGQAAQQTAAQAATKPALTASEAVQQGIDSSGGFPTNATKGLTNVSMTPIPGAAEAELALRAKTAAGGIPTNLNMPGYQGTPLAEGAVSSALGIKPAATTAQNLTGPLADAAGKSTAVDAATTAVDAAGTSTAAFDEATRLAPGQSGPPATTPISGVGDITSAVRQAADPGFFASIKKFFTTRDPSALRDAFLPATKPEIIREKLLEAGFTVTDEAVTEIAKALAPTTLRTYGPTLAGLGALGSAAGIFEQPPMDPLTDQFGGMTGQKLIDMYPSQYTLSAPGAYVAPTTLSAADGGGIDTNNFPRRNGKISGPGTETSDDIPAMLSDGEFVMTAKAVRGAGNGSREAGMRNMYNIMSRFEGNA